MADGEDARESAMPCGIKGIDYIGVGVGAVIVDDRGRVFLARRGPKARNERGRWEFPGGAVRFGETQACAIVREIREEFGVTVEVGTLIGVADHILPAEKQHWVSPAYLCRIVSGAPEIREPEKCTEIQWVTLEELITFRLTRASSQTLGQILARPPGFLTQR